MSGREPARKTQRLTAYLRPWRFEPAVLAVFFAFVGSIAVVPPSGFSATSAPPLLALRLFVGLTFGVATYAYFRVAAWLLRRLQGRTWAFLLLTVVFAPICVAVGSVISTHEVTPNQVPLFTTSPYYFVRAVAAVIIISTLTGRVYNRIDSQRLQAEELRVLAESQRRELLAADERVRQQVGTILHDRFQSELVTSSLMLANVARDLDPIAQDGIDTVIARLNALHSKDLREVLVALGPDLNHVDLHTALTQIARQYEPAMTTVVHVGEEVESNRTVAPVQTLLGLYRITEQCLLNAVKHGQACHASVTVTLDADCIRLTVENDGAPFRGGEPTPGKGAAVITTWSSALGGSWSIAPREVGGAVLVATLPAGAGLEAP